MVGATSCCCAMPAPCAMVPLTSAAALLAFANPAPAAPPATPAPMLAPAPKPAADAIPSTKLPPPPPPPLLPSSAHDVSSASCCSSTVDAGPDGFVPADAGASVGCAAALPPPPPPPPPLRVPGAAAGVDLTNGIASAASLASSASNDGIGSSARAAASFVYASCSAVRPRSSPCNT